MNILPPPPTTPLLDEVLRDMHAALILFSFICAILTLAIIIDLVLGISKSLIAGRKIQSFKARKSAIKMISYYGSLMMCFMCDLVFIVGHTFERPYLSMLIGACLILIEIKSWFEKLSDKEQARIERSAKVVAEAIREAVPNVNLTKFADAIHEPPTVVRHDSQAAQRNDPTSRGGQLGQSHEAQRTESEGQEAKESQDCEVCPHKRAS